MHGPVATDAPSIDMADQSSDKQHRANNSAPRRTIRPRRVWPGGRAVVGGLLVAVSGIVLYAAYQGSDQTPTTQFVVTRSAVSPGTLLTSDHVGLVTLHLPQDQAEQAFGVEDDQLVLGSVAVQAMAAGELVQRSDIRSSADRDATSAAEISFEIDTARSLNGQLQSGERIDLIATFGSGPTANTEQILTSVRLVAVAREANSSVATDQRVNTLALDRPEDAVAVAAAIDTGKLTIIRAAS